MLNRRKFIQSAGAYSAAFLGLRTFLTHPLAAAGVPEKLGKMVPVLDGRLTIPAGFKATAFSFTGEEMADGLLVPGGHDGMAAFAGPGGKTLLVRNHELESAWVDRSPFGLDGARLDRIGAAQLYDFGGGVLPCIGGTTTLVFDTTTQTFERHFLSLAGTQRNCAGGPTPWGTWVTCEEVNEIPEPDAEKLHGYNFEVVPSLEPQLARPVALKAMGRFRHEAIAVEPKSGVVYETEDLGDGLLYRFIPHEPGNLAAGGRLQALMVMGSPQADTRNWPGRTMDFPVGQPQAVQWIEVADADSPVLDLRHRGRADGAAVFARGEGAWWAGDSAYFAMTNGGRNTLGQIFRYVPSPYEGTAREAEAPGTIELFVEPNDSALLRNCDNLTVAPWGDLVIAEDHKGICRLIGITPQGEFYLIATNPLEGNELAGVCFSPDGSTLFANVQKPGYTFAISGPWPQV